MTTLRKIPKKLAIFDHILLKGHDTSNLKENNEIKLHLKESLLIKRDKLVPNTKDYSYLLKS